MIQSGRLLLNVLPMDVLPMDVLPMDPHWKPPGEPGNFVWRPSPELAASSRLAQFMRAHGIATFDELMRRSTDDPGGPEDPRGIAWFWDAVIQDLDIRFAKPYSQVVDLSQGDPWPRWCVGGELNIVQSCLDKWLGTPTENQAALHWEGEDGAVRSLTYAELHAEVCRTAAALRRLGVRKGDVVAIFMPMIPEIAVALFAVARIGAIVLPLFSGYGPEAVSSRLIAAGAKVLFTADGFYRRGQTVAMKELADRAAALSPSVETLIVVRRTGVSVPWTIGRDLWWHDLANSRPNSPTEGTERTEGTESTESTASTLSEDPVMLIYTSGTTGQPKGAVHTHCGFPIKAAQDMAHCLDIRPSDTVYWVTDMGWMMGPWLVFGATLLGATMVLYEGAPDYPAPNRLWSLVERHRATVLGVSPTLIRALMQHGEDPVRRHDLSSLRILSSTGEPWNPDPWDWFFRVVGRGRLPILNYSGGTEISGGILCGNLLLPLKPTAFSGPVPGIAADVVDENGNSVREQVGELVIRRPWIGMTRGFWNEPERYLEAYWSRFPGLWTHGDWAAVDSDGMWYILGRSDDTIKVAGKRLGPAEVESILVAHPAVAEAACIGVPDPLKGQAVVCFCVLRQGHEPGDPLRAELREMVSRSLGKPLQPREIKFVRDLPKTRNAKLMRRVARAAYLGQPTGDLSALENPQSVEEIRRSL